MKKEYKKYTTVETYGETIMRMCGFNPDTPRWENDTPTVTIAIEEDFLCQQMKMGKEEMAKFLANDSTFDSLEGAAIAAVSGDKFAYAIVPDDEGTPGYVYPRHPDPDALEYMRVNVGYEVADKILAENRHKDHEKREKAARAHTLVYDAIVAALKDTIGKSSLGLKREDVEFFDDAIRFWTPYERTGANLGRFLLSIGENVSLMQRSEMVAPLKFSCYVQIKKEKGEAE